MQTCLWLARTMPFPLTSGDRIYTGKLVQALADTGVAITYVGLAGTAPPVPAANVTWHIVPGETRGRLVSLLSIMPLAGAQHATRGYRTALDQLLQGQAWDVLVVDHYGMGWVLDHLRGAVKRPAVLAFIGHDHEESVTRQQWQDARWTFPNGFYYLQNYLKTRRIERLTARACDVITAITDADAVSFRQIAPAANVVTVTPGYDGRRLASRQITELTPRAVVMFGSYRWSAKQANLKLFFDHAHDPLQAAGIEVRVVGDMDEEQRKVLQGRYSSALFTGFVEDPAPFLDARLAIVAEPIGGGFKLKLLDYIFNRLPIAALEECVAGLPVAVRRHLLLAPDLDALAVLVTQTIGDVALLDRLQRDAFAAADQAFNWSERGETMRAAIVKATRGAADPHVLKQAET